MSAKKFRILLPVAVIFQLWSVQAGAQTRVVSLAKDGADAIPAFRLTAQPDFDEEGLPRGTGIHHWLIHYQEGELMIAQAFQPAVLGAVVSGLFATSPRPAQSLFRVMSGTGSAHGIHVEELRVTLDDGKPQDVYCRVAVPVGDGLHIQEFSTKEGRLTVRRGDASSFPESARTIGEHEVQTLERVSPAELQRVRSTHLTRAATDMDPERSTTQFLTFWDTRGSVAFSVRSDLNEATAVPIHTVEAYLSAKDPGGAYLSYRVRFPFGEMQNWLHGSKPYELRLGDDLHIVLRKQGTGLEVGPVVELVSSEGDFLPLRSIFATVSRMTALGSFPAPERLPFLEESHLDRIRELMAIPPDPGPSTEILCREILVPLLRREVGT